MNTDIIRLMQIFLDLQDEGIFTTGVKMMKPRNGKHGDMCVVGGFTTTMVQETARNHDPQHVQYGIAWRKQPQHATEQLTTTPPPQTQIPTAPATATKSRATGATAAAVPTGRTPKQPQPDPQVVAVRPERQLSQLSLEKASASAWPATEQPDAPTSTVTAQHRTDAGVVRPQADVEITHHTPEPPTQKGPDPIGATKPQTEVSCDADTGTTRHATEQSHPDEDEAPELNGSGQKLAYVIVNAFLDHVTFESTEAETLIKQVILKTGDGMCENMLLNIDEVFEPIFYYFPNGLKDKTWWRPRDASAYIKNWREIAAWRERVETAAPTMQLRRWAPKKLPKDQVQSILREYIKDFIDNVASPQQKKDSWTKNKSRAEARLNFRCGSSMMAKVIWLVGLPNISEAGFAMDTTEEQRPLEQDVRESIATATETILNWLSMLANSIQEHKAAAPSFEAQFFCTDVQSKSHAFFFIGQSALVAKNKRLPVAHRRDGCDLSTLCLVPKRDFVCILRMFNIVA